MIWALVIYEVYEKSSDFYIYYLSPYNVAIVYSLKFLGALFFLIFIRAGLPRYRYDFLTKLGWAMFLMFIGTLLVLFYISLIIL